jgi:hypothetical protein
MDWECRSLDWTDRDFENFRYGLRETTVVTKLAINEVNSKFRGLLESALRDSKRTAVLYSKNGVLKPFFKIESRVKNVQ